MRILIITPYYLPGFKAGGPVRSLANLVDLLGDEIDFRVIAGNRDLGDPDPYAGIDANAWQRVGKALVAYVPMRRFGSNVLRRLIREAESDALYLNSLFQPRVFALPLVMQRLGLAPRMPVVIAPRGAFSRGAMSIGAWRKRLYLLLARWLASGSRILWHATSELEANDIRRNMGPQARIAVAANLSSACQGPVPARSNPKRPGRVHLAFLSRISPKKNLLGAIKLLRHVSGSILLDVYGPMEDAAYWQACRAEIARLPATVQVHYRDLVTPGDVTTVLAQYDAMLLPTLGENFGHAIIESLAAGCPVVISDRTPWRNLQARGVGWDLSLESTEAFEKTLTGLVAMDEPAHRRLRDNCRKFVGEYLCHTDPVGHSRQLFEQAVASASHSGDHKRRRAA
jgi:glycosyltransferase involved in cell wall biosynthesis